MNKITAFIKNEIVLCAAIFFAVLSMFFVLPDYEYLSYIDTDTLILLFCLMAVIGGFSEMGVFSQAGRLLLTKVKNTRQLEAVLIFICFFMSMFITNDVALITFVPFSLEVLKIAKRESRVIAVIVFQTVAANLGSMLTPIGNPQNLYLYSCSGMNFGEFINLMLPIWIFSFIMLLAVVFILKKEPIESNFSSDFEGEIISKKKKQNLIIYSVLFILCLFTVGGVLPHLLLLFFVSTVIAVFDFKIIKKVDYLLLLTFIGFFIFVGNMGRVSFFSDFLEYILDGNEIVTAAAVSQVISNVPAALLISGFTDKFDMLLVGTNIGGLGTLIASMASLISYKYFVNTYPQRKVKYLIYFTAVNVVFFAGLIIFALILLEKC